MGNRMSWRRRPVEQRLTQPQRLPRRPADVDYKKLRRLILARKLAPCFDAIEAGDDPSRIEDGDLEECPICFLWFPSLNRSRCCDKGICTECFLQMKPSGTTGPAQCPFCKTPCYAVEYRGARTQEEKGLELAEEQKVIEAKLRIQCEYENAGHSITMDQDQQLEVVSPISNLRSPPPAELAESRGTRNTVSPPIRENIYVDGFSLPNTCNTRHNEFASNLEEVMIMEAMWESLQDTRLCERELGPTCRSDDAATTRGGRHELDNPELFLYSSQEGENSSPYYLAEQILSQRISEPGHHRFQTSHNPRACSLEGPDGRGLETECFTKYSNLDAEIMPEPIEECRRSINIIPTSNTSVRSLLFLNDDAGQSCAQFSGAIMPKQSFVLTMESKA